MKYTKDNLTRINNDINGNPRYVIHYTALLNDNDRKQFEPVSHYSIAVARAKSMFGGKKFDNKQYGGGIVFQSYNPQRELDAINALHPADKTFKCNFIGRGLGSIGKTFPIEHTIKAQSDGAARAALHRCFDCISDLVIVEVEE